MARGSHNRREGPIARTLRREKASGGIIHTLYRPSFFRFSIPENFGLEKALLMSEALRGIDELGDVVKELDEYIDKVRFYKSCGGDMRKWDGMNFRGPFSMCNDREAIREYILRSKRQSTAEIGEGLS